VLEGHGNHLVTENEEEKYAAILNTMTASCLSAGKLCEVFYWSFRKSWVMVIPIPPLREWSRS